MKKTIFSVMLILLSINVVEASTKTAYSYVLMDQGTNRVLDSKNMNKPRLIASITNIMTT